MDRQDNYQHRRSYHDSRDRSYRDARRSSDHHRFDHNRNHRNNHADRPHRDYGSSKNHDRHSSHIQYIEQSRSHQSISHHGQQIAQNPSAFLTRPPPPMQISSVAPLESCLHQNDLNYQQGSTVPCVASFQAWQPSIANNVHSQESHISAPQASCPPDPDPREFSAAALGRLNLPQEKITETGIIPDAPYYELPAGLMVPLIPPHEREYKPLNPKDLRLPLPKFPDQNFMQLIDSYYKLDSKSRDNNGWDMAFIETYINQKRALAEMSDSCSNK